MALSVREASAALGISERTLWARTKAGEIPFVRIGGRKLYRPEALRDYLAAMEEVAESDSGKCHARDTNEARRERRHRAQRCARSDS